MILYQEFVKQAKKLGSRIAIKDRTLDREVTYSKALIGALILAKKFKKYSDGEIGVMIPTSAGCVLAVVGILMAGKVPAMINYSTGAAKNCRFAQKKCGFKTIITSRALLEKINCPMIPGMVCLEDIMKSISLKDKLAAALRSKLPASAIIARLPKKKPDDNLVILFTSGSEKEPKAVQLTHKNLWSNITALKQVFHLTENDIVMSILPLFHIFGFNANFWMPLMVGCKSVTYANPLDYKKIPAIIREEKATLVAATPIFFAGYLKESQPGDFASVRIALPGADKTPDWLRLEYRKKQNIELCEAYGATETSPGITVNTPEDNRPGSIGKPLPGVQVKIVDLDTGKSLPHGKEGKILVKGDLVMKGYLNDIEETSLRIEDGWYDTGDMGVMDKDGYLWHMGRLRRFVKIGGEMISLVQTEKVLETLLPSGSECCVVDVPDSLKGARIVAAITKKVETKTLIRELGKKLPKIAIPKTYVVIPELPKMGTGKIDFRTITEMVRKRDISK
ncbi:AMP-binding protein [candidate division KSB1 bacterium]|nr:AMP-binding protein [candidate division KSB1 bacterium]